MECRFHTLLMLGSWSNRLSTSGSNWQIFGLLLLLHVAWCGQSSGHYFETHIVSQAVFFVAGAVFGALLVVHGYEAVAGVVSFELRQFGRHGAPTRGMSHDLLWLRLCHFDLRFTVCFPCLNFVAGATLWECLVLFSFSCHRDSLQFTPIFCVLQARVTLICVVCCCHA